MKRLLLIISILFISVLSSCGLVHKTPRLVNEYDRISFKYNEASHEEWTRRHIDSSWSYSQGFYSDGKDGNYFHLYKDNILAYSYEAMDSFNVNNILYKDNKVYFILTLYGENDNKDRLGFIDEEYNYNLLYESTNNLSNLSLGRSIVFAEQKRGVNQVANIVSLDYDGKVLNSYSLDRELGYVKTIMANESAVIILMKKETLINVYLYNEDKGELSKQALLPDMYIGEISYDSNGLYILGYMDFYLDFNLSSVTIYEYKNNELSISFEIDIPEDYGYSRVLFVNYNDNIYLSFSVAIKDAAKSLYSRHIILKCNMLNKKIGVIYLNRNLSYNAFYSNGHIYLGNYTNSYVNNEASGDFIDFDLNQFN